MPLPPPIDTQPQTQGQSHHPHPQLTPSLQILHLIHHRNKNQHRRSPWFKHLALLRRHLARLISESTPPTNRNNIKTSPSTSTTSQLQQQQQQQSKLRVRAREKLLRRWIMPECYSYVFHIPLDLYSRELAFWG